MLLDEIIEMEDKLIVVSELVSLGALSQLFKIVSTYGQGEEDSGLELKWSRRY